MDVGIEFSHYRVIEHIGRGGMADVWSARDKRLSRTVAIKTVARDLSQDLDPLKLFEREAKTIANLEHPHVLPIYEFGDYDGQLYIVMRYVSGGSLEDQLERGPLTLEEVLRVAKAVGQALDYAHASNVIHLDLKPSNVLLDSYQSPYLADFGLATMVGPEGRAQNPGSGTLLYMAPEQLTSEQLDRKADIYSFAILLFHMITGQLPFDASMPLALMQLQMRKDLPELHTVRPGLSPALTPVLRRASALEPATRPDTLKEVLQQLESALTGGTGRAAPDVSTKPIPKLDELMKSTGDGLISRPLPTTAPVVGDLLTKTAPVIDPNDSILRRTSETPILKELGNRPANELISQPIDGLISRPPTDLPAGDLLISRPLPDAPAAAPASERGFTELKLDLGGLNLATGSTAPLTPEQMAQREIADIYQRARRAWARGQGRFLLGVTDYILIADAYAQPTAADLDEQGIEMLLRGALEYDHEIAYWWDKLTDEDRRRWVALHALRSENAPARTRALERLAVVKDAAPPQIPKQVAQSLQTEVNPFAQAAALTVLEARAPRSTGRGWHDAAYTPDIDRLIAQLALTAELPSVREQAARTIGRIRSTEAVRVLSSAGASARRALALVRDEAPSLPPGTTPGDRLFAWWANTTRRLSERPGAWIRRFVFAFLGGAVAFGGFTWVNLSGPGSPILLQEVFERATGLSLLFGLLWGLTILLAHEVFERLRGFWALWSRVLLATLSGGGMMMAFWGIYDFLPMRNPFPEWSVIVWAGYGGALAFGLLALVRLPWIVRAIVIGVGVYAPLFLVWHHYFNFFDPAVPIIYFRDYNEVFTVLIPMVIALALGATIGGLYQSLRRASRRPDVRDRL